jgi:hypothetical protein
MVRMAAAMAAAAIMKQVFSIEMSLPGLPDDRGYLSRPLKYIFG